MMSENHIMQLTKQHYKISMKVTVGEGGIFNFPIFFSLLESRLERNSIAAFLLMVKNLIRQHPVNQESLLHCHGPSIVGALLSKVSASHIHPTRQSGERFFLKASVSKKLALDLCRRSATATCRRRKGETGAIHF